ncbi:TolC family protein [Bizionia argentinensis JUB59]|uniref:TolC family protein n=1 Tax=Bizionia argentinensis JUB59 TaxID=1046627 RepID=G2E9K4_9FLAO|nr:TolC family protein [Bizionia argentinensis]EGV44994.1 TolC family protein [Bizionia argentinensis JUB59]
MKKMFSIVFLLFIGVQSWSQELVTLESCYQSLSENYPLVKQYALLESQNTLDIDAVDTGKLPQISFDAQASYLSDVIDIPIPNSGIEPPNNDQYRATLSVNQLIYNGGAINATSNLKLAQLKTQQKQLEVSLYQLKQRVNQYYFSILLQNESIALLDSKKNQLETKIKEVKSGIEYGTMLPASDKVIEAELLKIKQQLTEILNNKKVLTETLSSLIGKPLNASTTFQKPDIATNISPTLQRPELELFQLKKEEIESQKLLIQKDNMPKLFGFASGGYGNPGLNMLDNSFQTFYTVGAKLNWNVFDWNANKKKRESLIINKDIVDNEAEIFQLNTNIELNKYESEITKISETILIDSEIINLRKEVLLATESQLRNGVITTSTYITELTNLYEAENIFATHNIQLELAKANYNITQGQ